MDTSLQESQLRFSPLSSLIENDRRMVSERALSTAELRFINGHWYQSIDDVDRMAPFFMSMISADDHWMFIASNGALTCGRKCADRALFPYYSSDKLLDMVAATGPTTTVQLSSEGHILNWRPWSDQSSLFAVRRWLHKSLQGNRICFEENNQTLGLTFRYHWAFSRRYGFVRQAEIVNVGGEKRCLRILDGLQNVLPSGLDHQFQLRYSNLANAYKKSELHSQDTIGVFYLSSIPSDRAEPSEGLRATIVWHDLAEPYQILLSDRQLKSFYLGSDVHTEMDVCGQRGFFLTVRQIVVEPSCHSQWSIVADVHQDHQDLAKLQQELPACSDKRSLLEHELARHDAELVKLASRVDGIEVCNNVQRAARHLSNSLFNAMRGGLPADGYRIDIAELVDHLQKLNREVWTRQSGWLRSLGESISYSKLLERVRETADLDLIRICGEYLPLTFSRRHGDPTRPWNTFNIDIKNPDGSGKLAYEGNWRDIFQNWEALATSYPLYLTAMVMRFVNASTIDGYNPYRVTMAGFDWERLDDSDPWANIGYWGDHQIVYLTKLLEKSHHFSPSSLLDVLTAKTCVFANVPYKIREYAAIRQNPKATIDYDRHAEAEIAERTRRIGTDGQLVVDQNGGVHRASLLEKLLLTAAIKMTNWIPDAGIWLNTQRPEWNDAQNALVGHGASLVTVCYLRRYLLFLKQWLHNWDLEFSVGQVSLSQEVAELLSELLKSLVSIKNLQSISTEQHRHSVVERLQGLGQKYRQRVYAGVTGGCATMELRQVFETLDESIAALDSTIRTNKRQDGLYHSYNLLKFERDAIELENLDEMLEGQVAAIESGYLESDEIAELLDSLRSSRLYREDQQSYLLYPNRRLPRFDQRNCVSSHQAESIPLVQRLNELPGDRIIYCDDLGVWRFSAEIRNVHELESQLRRLSSRTDLQALIASDGNRLVDLFEQTFRHRRFTGRANTFFAYEGLGSIYWHMVSKLSLAACRASFLAHNTKSSLAERLRSQFRAINEGIWLRKSSEVYGAFPTDPYSHTPQHAGAQQPGMTGQVKEDILIRQLELGVSVEHGVLRFDCWLLADSEFIESPTAMEFVDVHGAQQIINVPTGSIGYTICQVPVIVSRSHSNRARLYLSDNRVVDRPVCELSQEETQSLFARLGRILKIEIDWAA